MANTKKHPSMRKKTACYSVQLKVLRDFNDKCEMKRLVPSNVVQELIEKYLTED